METVIEFNKKDMSVRVMSERDIRNMYTNDTLNVLHRDGHAIVNNDIEIFYEGCYIPNIVLTLEK